jgi:hypothetical protein
MAEEDEGILRAAPRDLRQQLHIEPLGDRSVIADHRVPDLSEQFVRMTPRGEILIVGRVARQHHRPPGGLPLLIQALRRHHQEVTLFDDPPLHLEERRLDQRHI